MRYLRSVICLMLASAFSLVGAMSFNTGDSKGMTVDAAGITTDPVAVIEPLPDTISNSTFYYLDAYSSYDLADDLVNTSNTLANFTWEVIHEDTTDYAYGARIPYRFHELGLYKIELTVRDVWGNEGLAFTAVISVDDLDYDGMPDWWELAYMNSMDQDADADYDSDGYSNLYEWFAGTLPNVADPQPTNDFLEDNWPYMVVSAVTLGGVAAVLVVWTRQRAKVREAKKIQIAVELERSLDED